jgi:hypothetical protein
MVVLLKNPSGLWSSASAKNVTAIGVLPQADDGPG